MGYRDTQNNNAVAIRSSVPVKSSVKTLDGFLSEKSAESSDLVVIVDSSSSMNSLVGAMSKWEHLLHALRLHFPDSEAHCITFSSSAFFTEIINPYFIGGCTNLSPALLLAKSNIFNLKSCIIISDGDLDDYHKSLDIAREFGNNGIRGDCIFIGKDNSFGAQNLRDIANAMNGQYENVDDSKGVTEIKKLVSKIAGFLPERTIKL